MRLIRCLAALLVLSMCAPLLAVELPPEHLLRLSGEYVLDYENRFAGRNQAGLNAPGGLGEVDHPDLEAR